MGKAPFIQESVKIEYELRAQRIHASDRAVAVLLIEHSALPVVFVDEARWRLRIYSNTGLEARMRH